MITRPPDPVEDFLRDSREYPACRLHIRWVGVIAAISAGLIGAEAQPVITEFLASNTGGLVDADGDSSDWIEIHNPDPDAVDLAEYTLTDDAGDKGKWTFPSVQMEPGAYLIVFASGKDSAVPGAELHTNFKLSSSGEYLALFSPGQAVATTEFTPKYPAQFEDESYGLGSPADTRAVTLIASGAEARWNVPDSDALGEAWRERGFDDASWNTATTGLGYGYDGLTGSGSDAMAAAMRAINATAYARIPFLIENVNEVVGLTLRLKYEDGFIAYLNGEQIGSFNEPETPAWNSKALGSRSDSLAEEWEDAVIDLTGLLNDGVNVLAVQMLNSSAGGSDLLFLPELIAETIDSSLPLVHGYLLESTPGSANGQAQGTGPRIFDVTENPAPPAADASLKLTARVIENLNPISSATLFYRVMFDDEVAVDMTNESGVFSAMIPAGVAEPGQMLRWAVEAADSEGASTRSPRHTDGAASPEYFGTIVKDAALVTKLPVLHRFLESPSRAESRRGTRCSVFYQGEFYDNIFIRIRGGTAVSWPKKSYKLEFNQGNHFRFRGSVPRVDEINLNATYTDKSYMRARLTAEMGIDAGTPSPETFHIRMHQNGEFYSVALVVEQPDKDFLRRNGLDTRGQLYKGGPGSNYDSVGSFEKKTNTEDRSKDDLQGFLRGLRLSDDKELEGFVFDNVAISSQINFLAVIAITQNIDGSDKNHYLYRDTFGGGGWRMLPWDLDLTFGPNALNTDTIVYSADRDFGAASHVFIGATPHLLHSGKYNRLIDAMVAVPRTREMLLRRVRTLADEYLGTPYFFDRIDELQALIAPDVALDRAEWGSRAHFGGRTYTLEEANQRIKDDYLTPRYGYLTVDQAVRESSGAVPVNGSESSVRAMVPTGDSLGLTWTAVDFDDSRWLSGTGGVGFERGAGEGYEPLIGLDLLGEGVPAEQRIDANGDGVNETNSVYMRYAFDVQDPAAFGFLQLSMQYDDGYIAYINGVKVAEKNAPSDPVWDSTSTRSHSDALAGNFEPVDISEAVGLLVPGRNVLAIHGLNQGLTNSDLIFVPRLADEGDTNTDAVGIPPAQSPDVTLQLGMVNASGATSGHYVEVRNPGAASVDLSGWRLSGAVARALPPGTVLPAGDRLFVAADVSGFRNRSISPTGGEGHFVEGDYTGALTEGARVELRNTADGVVATALATVEGLTFADWIGAYLEAGSPSAAIDADPDGDRKSNLMEYGLASRPDRPDGEGLRIAVANVDAGADGNQVITVSHPRPQNPSDLDYVIEQSSRLSPDSWEPSTVSLLQREAIANAPGTERVTWRLTEPTDSPAPLAIRLRVELR